MDWRTGNEIPVVGPSFSERYGLGPAETPRTEPASPREDLDLDFPFEDINQGFDRIRDHEMGSARSDLHTSYLRGETPRSDCPVTVRGEIDHPGAYSYMIMNTRKRTREAGDGDASGRFPGSSTDAA